MQSAACLGSPQPHQQHSHNSDLFLARKKSVAFAPRPPSHTIVCTPSKGALEIIRRRYPQCSSAFYSFLSMRCQPRRGDGHNPTCVLTPSASYEKIMHIKRRSLFPSQGISATRMSAIYLQQVPQKPTPSATQTTARRTVLQRSSLPIHGPGSSFSKTFAQKTNRPQRTSCRTLHVEAPAPYTFRRSEPAEIVPAGSGAKRSLTRTFAAVPSTLERMQTTARKTRIVSIRTPSTTTLTKTMSNCDTDRELGELADPPTRNGLREGDFHGSQSSSGVCSVAVGTDDDPDRLDFVRVLNMLR